MSPGIPLWGISLILGGHFRKFNFYPRDAMLPRVIAIATCLSVRLSVRPSVRPPRAASAGIVSKQRKLAA